MEDMGVSKYRKGINLFAEWFEPYSAADYASLFDPGIKRTSFKRRCTVQGGERAHASRFRIASHRDKMFLYCVPAFIPTNMLEGVSEPYHSVPHRGGMFFPGLYSNN
eukprot:scaffold229656_cov18-Tisochrysis_lutea.AAC.1